MNKLNQLAELGQTVWLDYIRRAFINSGELQALVEQGVRGVTSNPSILEMAIAGSADYDQALGALADNDHRSQDIYEALVLDDIGRTADLLWPQYEKSDGRDGFVSLEVKPSLAHDVAATIGEAHRLFAALDRPNVMIKVPATAAGIQAAEALIGAGVNVNLTLIFSVAQYEAAANAYLAGLERLAAAGGDLTRVVSVASFFVSRVDTAVDPLLARHPQGKPLLGQIAIANAKLAYARFRELLDSQRWAQLAAAGANVQRLLWASTGTKNPLYADTIYVDNLIDRDTVNTLPPATLNAWLDHGRVDVTLSDDLAQSRAWLARLPELDIDLAAITEQLQREGLAAFQRSFENLLASIDEKRKQLEAEWQRMEAELHDYQLAVDRALAEIQRDDIVGRIWAHDHTVWQFEPDEIANRLGWLHTAGVMAAQSDQLKTLARDVRADGFTHLLLLGMGGSSLAPAVLSQVLGAGPPHLEFVLLDSTDPAAVLACQQGLDPARTLIVVSTKSGRTVETLSFFKTFYNWVVESLGVARAGAHFIAITDPHSGLAELAAEASFRSIVLNDPNIGGRYSALSYFGLLPAALVGVEVDLLLRRALTASCNCESCNCSPAGDNHGAQLGAIMAELAAQGRDKLTLIASPPIASLGDWIEQLVAESTGKQGKGILPIVGEAVGRPDVYGDDRLFVYLRLDGDGTHDAALAALAAAGQPVVRLHLKDRYDLGEQFFLWQMATAVAGHRLGINPFDQPDVEATKLLTSEMVATYQADGVLPRGVPDLQVDDIALYDDHAPCCSLDDAMTLFLYQADPASYIALQAFLPPTPEIDAALKVLREQLRERTRLATTLGYGPRFLHSTGQLHKGDAGRGLFVQFTADGAQDEEIPDQAGAWTSSVTFAVLQMAQVLGDYHALKNAGRRVIRFHLGADPAANLQRLAATLL